MPVATDVQDVQVSREGRMPVATAAVKPTRMSLRRLNINHLHRTLGKYAFALFRAQVRAYFSPGWGIIAANCDPAETIGPSSRSSFCGYSII